MDNYVRSRLCRGLFAELGVPRVARIERVRSGRLSGVDRLHLPDGSTRILKHSSVPGASEHWMLRYLRQQNLPAPVLLADGTLEGTLAMLLEDLGEPIRTATHTEVVRTAALLHGGNPAGWLVQLDEPTLAALPVRAFDHLELLFLDGRYLDAQDVREHLAALACVAARRASGAERAPWGLCHGELDGGAVHIGESGCRLLGFGKSIVGPCLLDLASYSGLCGPVDPSATRDLIQLYIHAGGHPGASADRGGLSAQCWALGWYRVHAAARLLSCAVTGTNGVDTDPYYPQVLRQLLKEARELLGA